MLPPVVYLDTQDFSRFGDVLRGKSNSDDEALFLELESRRIAGDVIFVASMPMLAELLQYHQGFRETTICKAQAVERLCGPWALPYPSRLIAAEIAQVAEHFEIFSGGRSIEILNNERYWYPNVADVLDGFRERIIAGIPGQIQSMGLSSRHLRRKAASMAKKLDATQAVRDAVPAMARDHDIPESTLMASLGALVAGKIDSKKASRRLFTAIAEPVKFVETYFEKIENDRSLPLWIKRFGENVQINLQTFKSSIEPFLVNKSDFHDLKHIMRSWPDDLSATVLSMAKEDIAEFNIEPSAFEELIADSRIKQNVHSALVVGEIVPRYVEQILALSGQPAKIEHSFGGDLIHAMYLPHVDLWRADRRFSQIVKTAVPKFANRVIARRNELVQSIDRIIFSRRL